MQRGDRVFRKANTRPILGTITETWTDRLNRLHARVQWERTLSPGHRFSGNDAIHTNILASSLVLATGAEVTVRTAAHEAANQRAIAARNAKRAGSVYPVCFGVFDVSDGTPRTTRLFSASDPANLVNELARYARHYPDRRFAILGYEDGWDETGERRTRRWLDDAV